MVKRRRESKQRNLLHDHPLMRKGGVHEKPYKAKRMVEKQKMKKEWCSLIVLMQCHLITPF